MITISRARQLRKMIETLSANLSDADASTSAELFQRLKQDGSLVSDGTRINWGGTIKRAAVDLWDTAENSPDNAPDLWEDIGYRDGIRIIPETITAGLAFSKDELGWWGDVLYKSILPNANVWTPEQYPDGWEEVTV